MKTKIWLSTEDPGLFDKTLASMKKLAKSSKDEPLLLYLEHDHPMWVQEQCMRADGALPPGHIQSAWTDFMDAPSPTTAKNLCDVFGIRKTRRAMRCSGQKQQDLSAVPESVHGGMQTPLEQLKKEYRILVAMDTLHDLCSMKKRPYTEREAWIRRLLPDATPVEVESFVKNRKLFNKEVIGFTETRLNINLPQASRPLNHSKMLTQDIADVLHQIIQPDGSLKIVLDGIVTQTKVSARMAALAAYLLLMLEHLFVVVHEDPALQSYSKDADVVSRVRKLRLIDGSFMERDGMFLQHFVNRYMLAVQGITRATVTIETSDIHPTFFKKYYCPTAFTSVDHVLTVKPWKFPVIINRQGPAPSLADWSIPYPKPHFQELFAANQATTVQKDKEKLDTVIAVNFLRDAHRVDLAARMNALLLTTDTMVFLYHTWLRHHHSALQNPGIWLNIKASDGHVSSVELRVL